MQNIENTLGFMKMTSRKLVVIFLLTICLFSGLFNDAHAQAAPPSPPAAQCTYDNAIQNDATQFSVKFGKLVQNIILRVHTQLFLTTEQIYTKIIISVNFFTAIVTAVILFIMIYGILFMSGMMQIRFYDFAMNLIKIGIVLWLFSPGSWLFFNTTIVKLFNEGTVDMINFFTDSRAPLQSIRDIPKIGDFLSNVTAGTTAFTAIDNALAKIISGKMFVILLASLASEEVYGVLMGGLMLIAIWLFLKSLMTALWVYIMSLIMKALLFGLAPIFIPTILFRRTRHLFDNWLNQIVSASLQPILLFIFFVFFVKLMDGSIDNILKHPVCWTKLPTGWQGSPMDWYFWRFAEYKDGNWVPNPNKIKLQDGFPIPLVQILTFLIIAELANRFNTVVLQIAMQISQASVSLAHDAGSGLSSMMGTTMAQKRVRGITE